MVFGFGKKPVEGVGCYGKLPRHGDYVSHLSDGAEAHRLTAWLDEGYRLTGGRDDREAAETWFVLPGPRKTTLHGAIWPSSDASGTRRFPFALFAAVPARSLAELHAFIPLALAPAWGALATAWPEIREAETPDLLGAGLKGLDLPEFPDAGVLRSRFIADLEAAAPGGSTFPALADVRRLGSRSVGRRGVAPPFALCLPIGSTASPEAEASFWIEALARSLGAPTLPEESHLFLRAARDDRPGRLFVIHRDLRPEDLGFVLAPAEDYPYGNIIGGDDPEAEHVRALRELVAAKLGEGTEPNLRQLLEL